jgi:superfamily II DNA or RNA helicase
VDDVNESRWSQGEVVMVRGQRWRVEETVSLSDCSTLRLTGVDLANPFQVRTFLLPFDRPRRIEPGRSVPTRTIMRPRRWLRALQERARDVRPFGGLSSAVTSKVDLLPYQLEPALAMRRYGHARVMIADAVGLGKTIQAGLLIRELSSEHQSFRALVVTPAGLRDQWAAELATRFGVTVEIVTSTWLARTVREVPSDVGPWALPGVYLSSFEYMRRPEVLRPLEDLTWDLLVVDEAHAATPRSDRRAAVHAVGLRSRRVILLTATPHGGDDEQFRALCDIGRSDERPDPLLIFCRSRTDVGTRVRRRSVLLPVRPSRAERRMHRLLERYTACVYTEARAIGNGHARLLAIVLRKRALSGAGSLAVSCRRRLALLAVPPDASLAHQLSLPLDGDDFVEDAEPDLLLGVQGLANAAAEQRWLEKITTAAEDAAKSESKISLLRRLVRRIQEPLIIFTEFRDTLTRLQEALSDLGRSICTLHGGMTGWERLAAQDSFNRAGSLLLATDAAAEGLNLHFRCRAIVHFELPWSPSRLEQRIGRVDRVGQSRIVHQIMLIASDTAERLVLAPLAKRAARARPNVAGGFSVLETFSESRVASAVMDGTPIEPFAAALGGDVIEPPPGLREEARLEALRLTDLRRYAESAGDRPFRPRQVCATVLRTKRRVLPAGLIRIYLLALKATDGTIVHSELMALREPTGSSAPPGVDRLSGVPGAHATTECNPDHLLATVFRERIAHLTQACSRTSSALVDRERVISLPITSAARRLVQGSLFDRRAIRASHEHQRTTAAVLEEAKLRIEALMRRASLTSSVTLTAVLRVEDRSRR